MLSLITTEVYVSDIERELNDSQWLGEEERRDSDCGDELVGDSVTIIITSVVC